MKQKKLNQIDIAALVVGAIIGWGSFSLPGTKFLGESGVIGASIGFMMGGIAILFIQAGYHIMMRQHGDDGGEFSYVYRNMGRSHGFVVGWSLVLCYLSMIPLNATALVMVLKQVVGEGISRGCLYSVGDYPVYLSEILIGAAVILVFLLINKRGLRASMAVQNMMALLLVLGVVCIFICMLFLGDREQFHRAYVEEYEFSVSGILRVVAIVPFLFVGFDVVPQVATDLGFPPGKTLGITVISILTGVLLYSLLNAITGLAYTPEEAGALTWATGAAVRSYVGDLGFFLLLAALFAAVTGGINGFMISSSKITASLSDYGLLPAKYGRKNERGILSGALNFVALISFLALFLGREVIIYIVDLSSALASVAYLYVCGIGLRYASGAGEKIATMLGMAISLLFMGLLLVPFSPSHLSKGALLMLVIWLLLGMLYYLRIHYGEKVKQNR